MQDAPFVKVLGKSDSLAAVQSPRSNNDLKIRELGDPAGLAATESKG